MDGEQRFDDATERMIIAEQLYNMSTKLPTDGSRNQKTAFFDHAAAGLAQRR
jgi:hypothetical protein